MEVVDRGRLARRQEGEPAGISSSSREKAKVSRMWRLKNAPLEVDAFIAANVASGHPAIDVTPVRLEDDHQLLLALVVGKGADHGRRHDC